MRFAWCRSPCVRLSPTRLFWPDNPDNPHFLTTSHLCLTDAMRQGLIAGLPTTECGQPARWGVCDQGELGRFHVCFAFCHFDDNRRFFLSSERLRVVGSSRDRCSRCCGIEYGRSSRLFTDSAKRNTAIPRNPVGVLRSRGNRRRRNSTTACNSRCIATVSETCGCCPTPRTRSNNGCTGTGASVHSGSGQVAARSTEKESKTAKAAERISGRRGTQPLPRILAGPTDWHHDFRGTN